MVRLSKVIKEFILKTDGSKIAINALLKQQFDDTGFELSSIFLVEY